MAEEKKLQSRKGFLKILSGITILGGLLSQIGMFLRSIVPNVLYEPMKKFKIGKPEKFSQGLTFRPKERLFIIKKQNEFHSISAICTHLGCTVKEKKFKKPKKIKMADGSFALLEWEFICPCHGSRFHGDGHVYDGPAPENLFPFHMSKSLDGNLVVDTNKRVDKSFRIKT